MQGEEERRQPGPGHGQPPQDGSEQQRFPQVEDEIRQMVAERVLAPEPPLEPQAARSDRPVVGAIGRAPHVVEAVGSPDPIVSEVRVIVPDELAAERGKIGEPGQDNQPDPAPKSQAAAAHSES